MTTNEARMYLIWLSGIAVGVGCTTGAWTVFAAGAVMSGAAFFLGRNERKRLPTPTEQEKA